MSAFPPTEEKVNTRDYCSACGVAKRRLPRACPDGRLGCAVAHYYFGCPNRCDLADKRTNGDSDT